MNRKNRYGISFLISMLLPTTIVAVLSSLIGNDLTWLLPISIIISILLGTEIEAEYDNKDSLRKLVFQTWQDKVSFMLALSVFLFILTLPLKEKINSPALLGLFFVSGFFICLLIFAILSTSKTKKEIRRFLLRS